MKPKACLSIVVFWFCCALHASAQTVISQSQYRFDHFDTNDGLPPFVLSMAQDSLGFIWFQYYGGLSRFDGYDFKIYKHDPDDTVRSLPSGRTGYMLTDHSGNLWVAAHTTTRGFPLWKHDRRTDAFMKYEPSLDRSIVDRIVFDRKDPVIWFCTLGKGLFSFNLQSLETKNYLNDHPDSLIRSMSNFVSGISDRDSCLLITSQKGLWLFDKKTKTFSRPNCNAADAVLLYQSPIWDIDDGPNKDYNDVWLWSSGKLLKVDQNLSVVKQFDFRSLGFIPHYYERDKEGIFWFATLDKGLYRYDPRNNSLINIKNIPGDINSLRSNSVNSVLIDKEQNVWINSGQRGVSLLQKQSNRFYNFNLLDGKIEESAVYHAGEKDFVIISKVKDRAPEILIASINPDRLDSLKFETIAALNRSTIHGLWKGKHNFWISAYGQGIASMSIDPASGMIIPGQHRMFSHDPKNANTISSNRTGFVWEDPNENLWVGTRGSGLNKINTRIPYGKAGSVIRYAHTETNPNSLGNDIVWNIHPESDTSFWIMTETGIDLFRSESFDPLIKNKTGRKIVYKISDSILFVGGMDGIYEGIKQGNQYKFSQDPILKIDDPVRIQQDRLGRLWISTTKSMVCYDRSQGIAADLNEKDGFDHYKAHNPWYKEGQTSQGMIVVSDQNGISMFDPLSFQISSAKTFPVLTRLRVNNQTPVIGDNQGTKGEAAIPGDIAVLDELVLDYEHANFAIEFSSMEMTSPDKNLYRYMLEGYDKDWIDTDRKNRIATYTNLDAGDYIFKVKASNHHGIWSDHETTLVVRILPPPWQTWWAYTLYALAFIALVLSWRKYDIKRVKLKHRAEYLSELDNLKTRFFTNISHEFRSPITLILGPLNKFYHKASAKEDKEEFGIMIRNGQRLLRLINQLLDLSRLEARKMRLHASPVDLVEFLKEIGASYESLASDKKIKFVFYPEAEELFVYIDPEKIEKVVHNLLSNAFKFTKPGGEVILNLKTEKKQCFITVKDTGIGIPSDQLEKVFDRFYQVDSSQTRAYEGSGLGMALAKELVELHRGKISVQSTEGKGTIFTVLLPLGKEHLNKEEISGFVYTREAEILSDLVVSAGNGEGQNEPIASKDQAVVLIVEDNEDMRKYIRKTLSDRYQILEAGNGQTGLAAAIESVPDLIISDIMMPEMDGYKLCELIKSNELTSHIPVILLTAKADRESKLTGLQFGADDYLSKPFDADELKLIVRNRIEERRKMRERFSKEITLEPKQISINSLDEKFLTKVLAIVEEHMDDENFSIEELSREAGFSNMHFYRKIKGMSGQTPSQFVRTIRLKRAAELLAKDSDNVTQIAYSVGFSSLSYFNKCFKEQFGVTPGKFAEKSVDTKK